jgi:succinate dehydrogenase / fumarate reductase cytochrome b subunit
VNRSSRRRPVFLDLTRIRFPVGAIASIGHRISGVLLVLALPLALLSLQRSLEHEGAAFAVLGWQRLPAALLAWAAAHHLFAGIRHLLTDIGIAASLSAARKSAYAALIGGAAVALWALVA